LALEPKKILVIRLSSMGDILLTTPLLRVLRKRFPNAKIDFVVKNRFLDLLRTNPHIDQIYSFDETIGFADLRRIKHELGGIGYDIVIDIHKNFRSGYLRCCLGGAKILKYSKYRIRRFILIKLGLNLFRQIIPVHQRYIASATSLNLKDDGQGLELLLDQAVISKSDTLLKQMGFRGDHPVVGITPGAGFNTKRWLSERFTDVARRLVDEDNAEILLFGDAREREITTPIAKAIGSSVIDLGGQLTLMETACAMAHCDVVLCNDTGLMHLASALGKKIVAIFGPTTKELGFFPLAPNSQVIQVDLKCRPCSHVGSRKCPKGHFRCMRDITVDSVYEAVRDYLPSNKSYPVYG